MSRRRRKRSARGSIFQSVSQVQPGRSAFDLSYEHHTTVWPGRLYPFTVYEVYPSDHFTIGGQALIRMQPTVSPFMTDINFFYDLFYVPWRLVWDLWEEFITRGESGDEVIPIPLYELYYNRSDGAPQLPSQDEQDYWRPILGYTPTMNPTDIGTLWDALGFPIRMSATANSYVLDDDLNGVGVTDLVRRAYVQIFNDYYRDENLLDPIPLEDPKDGEPYYSATWLFTRAWHKDYFTSALPFQQRGTAPAIPLSGVGSVFWPDTAFKYSGMPQGTYANLEYFPPDKQKYPSSEQGLLGKSGTGDAVDIRTWFNTNLIDLSNVGTFTMTDFRYVNSMQVMQEINARGGSRYTEQIRAHFGYAPSDSRLQRAEYLGGMKVPISINEVVQTSGAVGGTPQGNLAGHGMGVGGTYVGKFKVPEHGVIIGLGSIMFSGGYQQGAHRSFTRRTTFDYYFPCFAGLSEQAIYNSEIYVSPAGNASGINAHAPWAFQGRYSELRGMSNVVSGQMRLYSPSDYDAAYPAPATAVPASLAYWNSARGFDSLPPFNWEFMLHRPRLDNFVVQDEPPFIVQFATHCKAVRPMPYHPIPRLLV